VRLLGWVQVAMGLAALATLPVYASSFAVMQHAMGTLTPSPQGYVAFNLFSHALCIAVMFPAAFCAGMTLPLITLALLRAGAGERAIGRVYAANTAGAIAGVLAAVHLGLPLLGLKGLIAAGAALDLALGVVLLRGGGPWRVGAAASVAGAALLAAVFAVRLDAHEMASGVFRHGVLLNKQREQVYFQRDGKTATVSVTGSARHLSLRTNGKSDGSIRVGDSVPTCCSPPGASSRSIPSRSSPAWWRPRRSSVRSTSAPSTTRAAASTSRTPRPSSRCAARPTT
jgi:hypothetical protein